MFRHANPTIAVYRLTKTVSSVSRFNGVNNASIQPATDPTAQGLGLGAHSNDGFEKGNVLVYEVLHYPFILTDSQAQQTEAYLNHKYAIY